MKSLEIKSFIMAMIALCAIFVSCHRNPDKPDIGETIIGSWRWVCSYGGYGGQYIFADSVDYQKFVSLDINSIYTEMVDDSVYYRQPYRIEKKEVWGDTAEVIIIENYPFELIIDRVDRDTLVLNEYCNDCYTHTFVRLYPI